MVLNDRLSAYNFVNTDYLYLYIINLAKCYMTIKCCSTEENKDIVYCDIILVYRCVCIILQMFLRAETPRRRFMETNMHMMMPLWWHSHNSRKKNICASYNISYHQWSATKTDTVHMILRTESQGLKGTNLWPWASYKIRKIANWACARNAGNVFPPPTSKKPLLSDPGMHHGTCVTQVPWCMLGIGNPRWRGKLSRHSRRMRNTQLYVFGKRSIQDVSHLSVDCITVLHVRTSKRGPEVCIYPLRWWYE